MSEKGHEADPWRLVLRGGFRPQPAIAEGTDARINHYGSASACATSKGRIYVCSRDLFELNAPQPQSQSSIVGRVWCGLTCSIGWIDARSDLSPGEYPARLISYVDKHADEVVAAFE